MDTRLQYIQEETPENKKSQSDNLLQHGTESANTTGLFLAKDDHINLAYVSKNCRSLFHKSLLSSKTKILLEAVVKGNYKKVEEILLKEPLLLLEKETVVDFSGRIHVNKTAYQLALGAGDFNVLDKHGNMVINGMVELIEKAFNRVPNKSPSEISDLKKQQYEEQFPEGYDSKEQERIELYKKSLEDLFVVFQETSELDCYNTSTIENTLYKLQFLSPEKLGKILPIKNSLLKAASNDEFETLFETFQESLTTSRLGIEEGFNFNLLKALYKFRNHLEIWHTEEYSKHFNYQLLLQTAQVCQDNFVALGGHWNNSKIIFCFQKVLGYVERFVPACDAQAFAQGFLFLMDGEKSKRTLLFRSMGQTSVLSYYPLDNNLTASQGYNAAVFWDRTFALIRWAQDQDLNVSVLKTYFDQKEQAQKDRHELHNSSKRLTYI